MLDPASASEALATTVVLAGRKNDERTLTRINDELCRKAASVGEIVESASRRLASLLPDSPGTAPAIVNACACTGAWIVLTRIALPAVDVACFRLSDDDLVALLRSLLRSRDMPPLTDVDRLVARLVAALRARSFPRQEQWAADLAYWLRSHPDRHVVGVIGSLLETGIEARLFTSIPEVRHG